MRRVLLAATALALGACQAAWTGGDLELAAGGTALPGAGVVLGLAQRMHTGPLGRLDFEADLVRQDLDEDVTESGRVGDRLDQFRVGLRLRPTPEARGTWAWRAGVTWLRAQGDPEFLSSPGDYGGGYVGVGYEWRLAPGVAIGPDLALALVDAEGTGDAGLLPTVSLRLLWSP